MNVFTILGIVFLAVAGGTYLAHHDGSTFIALSVIFLAVGGSKAIASSKK